MGFKTRRQARYEFLRKHGFLRFEARPLSKVPLRVPYFDELIKERSTLFEKAIKEQKSQKEYEQQIKDLYKEQRWYRLSKTGARIIADPWQMYRDKEEAFRRKYPQYTSPWEKRQKDFRKGIAVAEKNVRAHYRDWISQLRESVRTAPTSEKRKQFEQRIKNLESWLE